jgi:hypothetical protein
LYGSAQGCGVGRERESYGFNMTKRYWLHIVMQLNILH